MKAKLWTISLLAGLALASSTQAALKIGDAAPALQVGKWIQGEPVKGFDTGKVYVVEFWATWCGPCRASIPHLNALYQNFKDKGVIVIGQDVWEQQEDGVPAFVKKMGTNMTYRVALDDKTKDEKGFMALNWMEAAGQHGIPASFIVNKQGRIAWIGHPMEMNEKLWTDIIEDHYDIAKAEADFDKAQKEQAQMQDISRKLSVAVKNEKWDDAEAALKEMEKAMPEDSTSVQLMRFEILLRQKSYEKAFALAQSISDANPDVVELQNRIAWTLVARPGMEKRDAALAEKIAARANKAAKDKDPEILDTLARAQFMNGKKDEAIATEQKAVDLADARQKPELQNNLASYKEGKLPKAED